MPTIYDLLQQLSTQAGPRGYTYAGRVMPQGQRPSSLTELMLTPAVDAPDAEGFGLLAAGIPLASKLRMPSNVKLPEVLNQMYEHVKAAYPNPPTKDQWIHELLTKMSVSGRLTPAASGRMKPFSSLSESFFHEPIQPVIPRSQQAAAVIDMAERSGLMTPERLAPFAKSSEMLPQAFKDLPVRQEYLDLLRDYLEMVKP